MLMATCVLFGVCLIPRINLCVWLGSRRGSVGLDGDIAFFVGKSTQISYFCFQTAAIMISQLAYVCVVNVYVLVATLPFLICLLLFVLYCVRAIRDTKRLESECRLFFFSYYGAILIVYET